MTANNKTLATMDDQTLIKAFLKKQQQIQDEFLKRLDEYQVTVDTSGFKKLLDDYKTITENAARINPEIDTTTITHTITKATTKALNNIDLSKLTDELRTQTNAIERNNNLLSNGTSWKLNMWILSLIFVFGGLLSSGVLLYFQVPAKIAGVSKYQTLQDWYDNINYTMRQHCVVANAYFKANNWKQTECKKGVPLTYYPLKTSQELISGN